uniref:PH domain-containing protein n=1 Tax=Kalmanozyma brasiliensis (strain GHG001) TaxID=1365824 RepID=V5EJP4_KALBG
MASTKAEFVASSDRPAVPALLSGSPGVSAAPSPTRSSPPSTSSRPGAQTRKSNLSRILRPRGKSVSHAAVDEWSRTVGGSEGIGSIYDSSMNSREKSQVLRSVTQLTKSSINDLTGAAAEAFSGNATPALSQSAPFFSHFRMPSSSNIGPSEAPPGYHQQDHHELRRASEGSTASHASLPLEQALSSSSVSSPRQSPTSRRSSYFSMASPPFASARDTPSSSSSTSAVPSPRTTPYQPQTQLPKAHRRSSGQLGAAARQAFRSSRSFLGLPVGITEDDSGLSPTATRIFGSADRNASVTSSTIPRAHNPAAAVLPSSLSQRAHPCCIKSPVSVALAPPTLSSASSATNVTTLTSPSTPNTIATAITTAATTPSQSTLKLTAPLLSSSSSWLSANSAALPRPSILLNPTTSSAFSESQHASSLSAHPLSSQQLSSEEAHFDSASGAVPSDPASSTAARTTSPQGEGTGGSVLPLTPPHSSGPCHSSRRSFNAASALASINDVANLDHVPARPPSPPASAARHSVSTNTSRRDSSTESALSSLSPLSPHSSLTSATTSPEPTPSSARGSGRVSFDLRRSSLFAPFSSTSKMTSNSTRASFAGIGNGLPPNAADANASRHTSSPIAGSASKFFSRIGGSRRGSAAESSPSSPETKSRSRFASFSKIGRSGDGPSAPKDSSDLRNSMQPWASASTDVLNLNPGQARGRNSLALAREEAHRPRKSLHLPRPNVADLESERAPRATALTSAEIYALNTRSQQPIAMAAIKPEKPSSPSLQSGRRPSFNFLRRASAASTGSNADNTNGERRGSFARTFMQKTMSRNSKSDTQSDAAKIVSTSPRENDLPVFRNGIFDSQAPASASSVAYPGMSSTVHWNAPNNAGAPSHADIAPNDVDPATVVIPAYPGSAAANGTPAQPKAVTDLASSILSQRRPSQGIDQEQDAAEATDTVADSFARRGGPSSIATDAYSSTDSTASRQRPGRSSNALSHLPRLNSMRAISGASQNGRDGTARAGSDSITDSNARRAETSDEEQELSEDEEDADVTGQTSDYHDPDETETDDETDYDNSPAVSRRVSAAPMAFTGSSGGLHRNRPTESLVLPPAPTFVPNISHPLAQSEADAAASTSGATPSTGSTDSSQAVGRESWTSFNTSGFTPFETPTPSMGGNATNGGLAGPTPRARQELSESSYFSARPGTSNSSRATTAGTMSGDAPPPSPSIISRSRAPSSASVRTLRTPGTAAISSGPVPNRSMPPPVGTLPPLGLNRQISIASGLPAKIGADRSKSPAQAPGSSRPSTSGTLTPLQGPASERNVSREASMDRPGWERPTQRGDSSATSSPRKPIKPLVGLDGVAPSSARPNFYHQKSQSLVDLLGPASRRAEIATPSPTRPTINEPSNIEALRSPTTPRPPSEAPAYSKKDGLAPINTGLTAPASIATPVTPSLGRRRSMFEMRAEPPGYSIIHNRPEGPQIILPREEEGREKLPTYYCGVHIEGYLPRKMEFSAPGVQAKDRSWKRQYFVLHGTSLRVYKNDLSVERHAVNGTWGEMKGVHVHLEPMNEDGSNGSGSGLGLGAAAREAISHTPLGANRHEAAKNKEATTQFDTKHGLVRNYTLQGAESGLAADYLKRRHVVRVRAEGEQFLLQTRSDRHVVDWIEALQASTNVSMDLEKRAMPKFITLPRRRRRRRRNPDGTTVNPEEQEARDLAEAQRRSVADASGRTTGATATTEATPRGSTSGRPSMSLENELNPSAAFERMLREDQEEGGRQSAAVM